MKIKNRELSDSIESVRVNGDPPKNKHWIVRPGIRPDQNIVTAIRTLHKRGALHVNREPNGFGEPIKDGRFVVTCALSGRKITSYGTFRVAKGFVDRIGPVWESLFVSIWGNGETDCDERLYAKLANVGRLFWHDDMGEDDGNLPYTVEGKPFVVKHVPASWTRSAVHPTVGYTEDGIEFGGPCAVIRDDGEEVVWVMKGRKARSRGLFIGNENVIVWLRFRATESGIPAIEEFAKLKSALYIR